MAARPIDPGYVRLDGPWRHGDVRANGIRFHTVEYDPGADVGGADDPGMDVGGAPGTRAAAGTDRMGSGDEGPNTDRPLVLLLHGFGQFWYAWRHQLPALHEAGYRAVAIDLRGYGDTDKPPRGYDGWTLAFDTSGLIKALGYSRAAVVGHADGGLVAWATALQFPGACAVIVPVSSPHPVELRRAALRDRAQRRALLPEFLRAQIPRGAENRLVRADAAKLAELLTARAGARWRPTPEFAAALTHYRTAFRIPGTAHLALEYQRWAFRSQFRPDGTRFLTQMRHRTSVPVHAIRGGDDAFMSGGPIARSSRWANSYRVTEVPGVGHFVPEEAPTEFNAALVETLSQYIRR